MYQSSQRMFESWPDRKSFSAFIMFYHMLSTYANFNLFYSNYNKNIKKTRMSSNLFSSIYLSFWNENIFLLLFQTRENY